MYGSPVSKDLNLPVQPPMTSSGLLRYRSAPSTLLGEVCEDFLPTGPRAVSPDAGADNVFSRFLADHQIRDNKPAAPAAAHFPNEAAMASHSQQQQQQQQQMMYHSQQQQMAAVEPGLLYRTVSNGMEAASAGAGGVSNLIRQSSSPAGFLNHLNMDNGWRVHQHATGGHGRRVQERQQRPAADSAAAAAGGGGGSRLKGQLSFSSRQGSLMSQISEMESEELERSSPEGAGGGRGFIPGYPMGSGWEDSSSLMTDNMSSGLKRPRESSEPGQNGLAHQFSLPKTSSEMAAIEKFLQFQDAVPCKIRAKRGCATHPRSIAERVRRTKISERIRKLQRTSAQHGQGPPPPPTLLQPQTNTSDMLDLAVDYIKDLQKQVKLGGQLALTSKVGIKEPLALPCD
ncbi:hypothetical protein PR202_gb02727 [Eleusine coracana subsp. coracana]|uniref:BHLH domain-containing protein n=1 Tax=Eleusine coracana subsp. coracana TaxID=191504 RepID=A0AAV5DZ93_ELECO|nr:hypothetical protein PR202_gb02727 [Eleusine coracana subsp. coracana]